MSPIFVRPVREQLEHDRLIRHLQLKYKRKFEVALNVGDEQLAPVKIGTATFFPDLVLTSGKKLAGVVEVETGESVNNLEAMAQWVHFGRARVPFHLYVPVQMYEAARRLSEANHARITEVWTYRPAADGFDLVRMFNDPNARPAPAVKSAPAPRPAKAAPTARPQKAATRPATAPAGAAKPAARAAASSGRSTRPKKAAGRSRSKPAESRKR